MSVTGSRELRAVALAVKGARRDIRNDINRATRATLSGPWTAEVAARARTDRDRAVIVKGAKILPGNPPVMVAASSRRRMKGGLVPADDYAPVEFGTDRGKVTTYQRHPAGVAAHKVTRHTARQMPPRIRTGRVAYPAVKEIAPRAVALWVQLVVRKFADAFEAGGRA